MKTYKGQESVKTVTIKQSVEMSQLLNRVDSVYIGVGMTMILE